MTATRRLPLVAGGVLFAYLVVWMLRLALLQAGPTTFDRTVDWSSSLTARLALCAVLLAGVYHALDGARSVIGALAPSVDVDGPLLRAAVRFALWALVIPGWVVLLRPWLEEVVR